MKKVAYGCVKWSVMISSYALIIASYWAGDNWSKELLASLAAIGFAATIGFWWKDR